MGRLRRARITLAAKHARALVKAYTDLRVDAAGVSSTYGVGLEPIVALVGPEPVLDSRVPIWVQVSVIKHILSAVQC